MVYGFGSVDDRGRVADLVTPRAMGWTPSTRLEISATRGLLVVHAHADGVIFLTKRGHLRLPTPYRRWYGLVPGDRVLLVAEPAQGRLVVHPPAALDRLISEAHADLLDGGVA
jgi:bifunctional DNA-binding transcriptional regulator/antitoxin component of YhaV-PrlF toxin-antitoxin module